MGRDLTIRQIEGPKRVIVISGNVVLPGFSLPMLQRGEVKHYDGAQIASVHTKGPDLDETTITIRLWTERMGGGGVFKVGDVDYDDADEAVRLLKDVAAEGALVSVTWAAETQVGYIARVDAPYGAPGRFSGVDIEFQWAMRDTTARAPMPKPERDAASAIRKIAQAWRVGISTAAKPASVARKTLATVETAVGEVNAGIRSVGALTSAYREAGRDVRAIRTGVIGGFRQISTGAASMRASLSDPAAVRSQTDDAGQILSGRAFVADLGRAAQEVRGQAEIARRRQALAERDDLRGFYTGKEGEDLRLVAHRFYGDVDAWAEIARFNSMTGSTLRGGQTIMLPDIRAGV